MALLDGQRPLPLVFAGDPVLRQPAAPYDFSLPDDLWNELLASMFETMHAAPGVGLAAPQIGLGIRVAVIEDRADLPPDLATERDRYPTPARVLVNPTYQPGPEGVEFYEGCLSVPGYQAVVRRATSVRLRCQDERGADVDEEVNGWGARIVAHETDHLDGTLYLDRALTRSLSTTANLLDLWGGGPVSAIRSRLGF
ncbi:peptide deformylase [Nakamurella sp. GG22]